MLRGIPGYLLEGESELSTFILLSNKATDADKMMANKPLEWVTCFHFDTNGRHLYTMQIYG